MRSMTRIEKALLAVIVIAVIGGSITVSATTTPKVWLRLGEWSAPNTPGGEIVISGVTFENGTSYHIKMILTPNLIEGAPNRSIFCIREAGQVVYGPYDWSGTMYLSKGKDTIKEYYFTPIETVKDARLEVSPYYGGYRIIIEYIGLVFDVPT